MTVTQAIAAKGNKVRISGYRPYKIGVLVTVYQIGRTWYGKVRNEDGSEQNFRVKHIRYAPFSVVC